MPSLDIVIRSYYRDVRWLAVALRSIELYVTGHRRTIVVLPRATCERIDLSSFSRRDVEIAACPDYADDYLGQQITKLQADRYSDADVIVHVDSDQVFVAPCDLQRDLFNDGRLVMTYDASGRRGPDDGWRQCPSVFFRRPVTLDLTTPAPLAVPRHVYAALAAFCWRTHHQTLEEYVLGVRADRMCELALLRGHAFIFEREAYSWVDVASRELLSGCRTFWSRRESPAEFAAILPPALSDVLPSAS